MPPVFGPVSPSPARLKSCAAPSGTARAAVAEREQRDLRPLEQLLDHDRAAERRAPRAAPSSSSSCGAADEDALACREPVGLDDARRARDRERRPRVGTPGRRHHLLREALRALDPRGLRARAEHGDAGVAQLVADAGDERRLGPDHDEIDVERAGEREQPVAVVGANGVAGAERRDARGSRARRGARSATGSARAARQARARARPSRRGAPSPRRVYFPPRPFRRLTVSWRRRRIPWIERWRLAGCVGHSRGAVQASRLRQATTQSFGS